MTVVKYTEDEIIQLEWNEHIRRRPGMYIGKLGDGTSPEDGIYVLIKEIIDNSIDEHLMGHGKLIEITLEEKRVVIRDYGRGIPLGKIVECVAQMNTGGKYDSTAFQKSIGLNGVGTKAVNALSSYFKVEAFRAGKTKYAEFSQGNKTYESTENFTTEKDGTKITFIADHKLFGDYHYIVEYIDKLLWNYAYLNTSLTLVFNDAKFNAPNGLLDLLNKNIEGEVLYPIVHFKANDIEIAFTHSNSHYSEEYFSFVNGQNTTHGGTHLQAFKEAIVKTIREYYKKDYEPSDIRNSIVAAVSIRVQEPVFESQTKTKLGSTHLSPTQNETNAVSIKNFIGDFIKNKLDNYLHINTQTAEVLLQKILMSEKERKDIADLKKLSKDKIKKVSLHNKKLRDCRAHYNTNHELKYNTTLFITEGDSASGSITKSRDVNTQAVFSLKGKPFNSYGYSKKIVYENDEFNLLQSALNIEDGLDNLRYNNVVIATDADNDGMHIRYLLMTFFLQFFPDLVKNGHVYILQTPLFRVRNKQKTIYCYSEEERVKAIDKLGNKPEITRFKGLGEISPDEFKHFIGKNIRLDPVILSSSITIAELLAFYHSENVNVKKERQVFLLENLRNEF